MEIIEQYAKIKPINLQGVENEIIADETRGHYQLVSFGWDGHSFVYSVIYHFDLKPDGKIWVQVNNTDIDLAEEFLTRGISRQDIVVGFQHPAYRQHTGFAVA